MIKRLSKILIPTLKPSNHTNGNANANGNSKSQNLLIRGGFIKQSSAAGIYSYLPLGTRVLNKLQAIIDQEMTSIDCQKMTLPCLLPSESWKKSGRWETSTEMFKLSDRKDAQFCLAPTHEEEITSLVASLVSSYRHLPLRLYQIGTKFRDELRPRSGLLRAREFIMKDLYTFDTSEEEALKTYELVREAYSRILDRIGIEYMAAEADTGDIGGSKSHEYHLISLVGQDTLLSCSSCGYAANVERAVSVVNPRFANLIETSIDTLLTLEWKKFSLVLKNHLILTGKINSQPIIIVLPQNYELNLLKLQQIYGSFDFTQSDEFFKTTAPSETLFLIDNQVKDLDESVLKGYEWKRNDFILSRQGDGCVKCLEKGIDSPLVAKRAIEIGHTFYLSTKYSKCLDANFKDSLGEIRPIEMGCFGLGVSRMIAAIVETSHDEHGIIWPSSIAPYKVCIIIGSYKNETDNIKIKEMTDFSVKELEKVYGVDDLVIDDRDLPLGSKLKDSTLIGYPKTIVIAKKYLTEGLIEVKDRRRSTSEYIDPTKLNSVVMQM